MFLNMPKNLRTTAALADFDVDHSSVRARNRCGFLHRVFSRRSGHSGTQ